MDQLKVELLVPITVALTSVFIKLLDYLIGRGQGKLNWTVEERKANADERESLRKWSTEQRAEMQTEINDLTNEIAGLKESHATEITQLRKDNAFLRQKMWETLKILRTCNKAEIGGTCEQMIKELEAL